MWKYPFWVTLSSKLMSCNSNSSNEYFGKIWSIYFGDIAIYFLSLDNSKFQVRCHLTRNKIPNLQNLITFCINVAPRTQTKLIKRPLSSRELTKNHKSFMERFQIRQRFLKSGNILTKYQNLWHNLYAKSKVKEYSVIAIYA